jgi:hypothetical protein
MLELIQQKFLGILIGTGRNNFIVEWTDENQVTEVIPEDGERREEGMIEPLSDEETGTEIVV